MFVGDEVRLDVSFAVAREGLTRLSESGALFEPSEDAYTGLARVGVAGLSKLVRVQVRELSWTDRSAGLALRWEAAGPGGGLFPVLDADLTLAALGEGTVLTMAGSTGRRSVRWARRSTGPSCTGSPPRPSGVSSPGWRPRSPVSPAPSRRR